MGKRQIGELDIGDLVSTLLISELAAIPIDDPDIPLMNAILPILFIFSLEILLSTLKNKSERLKKIIEGNPCFIIYKGRLLQDELKNNRLSLNELLCALRTQGIGDIGDVEYALLEQNGSISFLEKNKTPLSHPIVIDGEVIWEAVKRLGYNEIWLKKELAKKSVRIQDVFLMTSDDEGNVTVIGKDRKDEN